MRPGPDPLHTDPRPAAVKKRRRGAKPSVGRAAGELVVVLAGLVGIVALVPLTSRWFVAATAAAGAVAAGYALYGVARRPWAAKWWGFVWAGTDDEGLALGLYRSGVLFAVALVPVVAVKALVRTPAVPHPLPYFAWCFAQDFLFFSLVLKNLGRLTAGSIAWHRHFAVWGHGRSLRPVALPAGRVHARDGGRRGLLGVHFRAVPAALAGHPVALRPRADGHALTAPGSGCGGNLLPVPPPFVIT